MHNWKGRVELNALYCNGRRMKLNLYYNVRRVELKVLYCNGRRGTLKELYNGRKVN